MPGLSLGLGLGLTRNTGGGFSLAAFMASQADGFWYDFGQSDRLFQETNGQTPADDPNEVIGLAMDQRSWGGKSLMALSSAQTEILTNPDMGSATGWNLGTGWTIGGGKLNAAGAASGTAASQLGTKIVSGQLYRYSLDVDSISGSSLKFLAEGGASAFGDKSVPGSYLGYLLATASGGVYIWSNGTLTAQADNASLKLIPGYAATQATASLKPKFQTTGAAFDGSDDSLLTPYLAAASAGFIVAKLTVPATLSATQIIVGSFDGSNRMRLSLNTSGLLCAGLGGLSEGAIVGGPDLRGGTITVGLSFDGTTIRLFVGATEVATVAQSGNVPNTVTPFRLGSLNNSGTASNFFGGSIKAIAAGREGIDLARFNQIAAVL